MGPAGPASLPFNGSVDPRYACLPSVTPALPPPPMSMLYSSPPSGLLLPESFYGRPVIGFSNDSAKSSPELIDSLRTEAGRMSTTSPPMLGRHRQSDSAESVTSALQASGRTQQLSYQSLLLHTQLEALRHYQQQHQDEKREVTAADSESRPRCSTATKSSLSCETSVFCQPRRRHATPDHITSDTDVPLENTPHRTSPPQLHNNDARSPARKAGKLFYSLYR